MRAFMPGIVRLSGRGRQLEPVMIRPLFMPALEFIDASRTATVSLS